MTECRECGIPVSGTEKWTSAELQVCADCWWDELDAGERKQIAKEANE